MLSEFDQKRADRIEELLRKAHLQVPPEVQEEWNEKTRRELGFRGYGRGSLRARYRRGLRHVRNAADRFAEAGPQYADVVNVLEALLEAVPPFQDKS
jgi:hypothetical protein